MSEIDNYPIDFVERTKEILEEYYPNFKNEAEREVTFLLNCLLGLIITISENEKRKKRVFKGLIDEGFIELLPEKIGFLEKKNIKQDLTSRNLTALSLDIGHKHDLIGKDKFWLINKLRNGIAHQNIEGINEKQKWVGVRL